MAQEKSFHHTTAKMQLRHFRSAEGLWYFSQKTNEPVQIKNPASIFGAPAANTAELPDRTLDASAEQKLDREVENPVAPLLTRINRECAAGTPPTLTPDERLAIARLLYAQYKRPLHSFSNKAGGDQLDAALEQYRKDLVESGRMTRAQAETVTLTPEAKERVEKRSRIHATVHEDTDILDELCGMGLFFVVPTNGSTFVIGNDPVLSLHWQDGDVETKLLPVGSGVMIGFGAKDMEGKIVEIDSQWTRRFNEMAWDQSTEIAGPVKAQLDSLVKPYRQMQSRLNKPKGKK